MRKLFIDLETRSERDIKATGGWRYAADPSTEILCLAYAFAGDEPKILTASDLPAGPPFSLADVRIVSHNAALEYACWDAILHKRFGWPEMRSPEKWGCTLSRAAMSNLPLSLEKCGDALGAAAQKDLTGRAAMLRLCRPTGADPLSGASLYREDPELLRVLYDYCRKDVSAAMELDARLPELPPGERAIWELDLIINRRGVQADVQLAKNAARLAVDLTGVLNAKLLALTNGAVDRASQGKRIIEYLGARGVTTDSVDKESITALLARPDLSPTIREVLSIRRQTAKSSTAKYEAIVNAAGEDGRIRGALQYHGAGQTGRWAGRLFQLHNLPKGLDEKAQEVAVAAILAGDADVFSFMYGAEAMEVLSGALRAALTAPAGKKLAAVDYSTIEPRVLFWLAGETAALTAYRNGADLYVDLARLIFRDESLTKKNSRERAVGKFGVLGCGFQMGAPRFKAQCATNGLDIPEELAARAVKAYRERYKLVVAMWYAIEGAVKKAIREPGARVECCGGRVVWGMDAKREWLVARLPSGRHLRYFKPRIHAYTHPEYGDREEIRFWSSGLGGGLEEQSTYGGSLTENIVQAVARDLLANGLLNLEAAGFPVVLHVHDEAVVEIDDLDIYADANLKKVVDLMCTTPTWAAGCPVAAEGFAAKRYRK